VELVSPRKAGYRGFSKWPHPLSSTSVHSEPQKRECTVQLPGWVRAIQDACSSFTAHASLASAWPRLAWSTQWGTVSGVRHRPRSDRTFCKAASIAGATPHDARHTFAVHPAQAGIPIVRLQKLLGHADATMTMRHRSTPPKPISTKTPRRSRVGW
jgi:hypothetical protein